MGRVKSMCTQALSPYDQEDAENQWTLPFPL